MARRLALAHLRRLTAEAARLALVGLLPDELVEELAATRRDLAALEGGTWWDS